MFQTAFQANAFQNNAFQIYIVPTPGHQGGDDAWTPEERKRRKQLDKKLRLAEEKRIAAQRADAQSRKNLIREQISPTKRNKNKVELPKVSNDIPSQVTNYDALIANLERQKQDLYDAVLIRQAKARLEFELQVLEEKQLQELDDEQALLLLL